MADCGWHVGLYAVTNLFCYAIETILFLLLLIIPLTNSQTVSFDYPNFSHAADAINLEGDASVSNSVINLTKNALHLEGYSTGSVGRVRYQKPVLLLDKGSNEVYDFKTNFSFVVFSNQDDHGEGLAFFLASTNLPNAKEKPELKGAGLGIGIVNGNQTLHTTEYKFVAVEFDTNSNQWDPSGTHVGVNVNSMASEILENWWMDISESKVYSCSIEFNSRNNILNVSFSGYRFQGSSVTLKTQYLSYNIDLRYHLPESVIVGISAAAGDHYEEHALLSWSFSTSLPSNDDETNLSNIFLMGGIGIGIGMSVSLLGLCNLLLWKLDKGKEESPTSENTSDVNLDNEFYMGSGPKKIDYCELVTATNNFEATQKLGQGGFGGVYKGYWKDSNSYAAIKRISAESRQGIKEYRAEVKIISQLRHRNLVKLAGWCHEKNDLILAYEYMPNGSLDSHLFYGVNILSWQVRYNIALDLASALLYLQEGWEKCVLHRDIKSSNIMLDSNLNAKLGDFGLARLVDHEKESQTTVIAGTMGYLAPEYMNTGKARKQSDIFSFGVVLLELASGRKALHHKDMEGEVSLVEWVWELYVLRNLIAAADAKLCGEFDKQQMECLLVVGLWCANPDIRSRPCIRQVIKVLDFEAPLPILPQKIPVLDYLPTTTNELFFTVPSSFRSSS
ncbi:hypothetical protein RIF29_36087 [Crotalaria pallida]|uniref:non-specific serine/threonine protein kinase n=1 Tax=Crotalaria pallida TaxID=3830 RepID=A0AAN9HU50_CROPI